MLAMPRVHNVITLLYIHACIMLLHYTRLCVWVICVCTCIYMADKLNMLIYMYNVHVVQMYMLGILNIRVV